MIQNKMVYLGNGRGAEEMKELARNKKERL
jgi:hypothetical protein